MPPKEDYSIKETKPNIVGTKDSKKHPLLVELQQFLFIRVEGAKKLRVNPENCAPYVELTIGNYKATTGCRHNHLNPRWDQVYCFRKDILQSKTLEISVKDWTDESEIGAVSIPLGDAFTSLPGDGSLAAQAHSLLKNGDQRCGYLMMAMWIGNQTDAAYSGACHADAASVSRGKIENVGAKTYEQPKLWYLRVKVSQAEDLVPLDPNKEVEVCVRARLGDIVRKTKASSSNKSVKGVSVRWNEELMFVAAEPFDDTLFLSLQEPVDEKESMEEKKKKHVFGVYNIPLHKIDKRLVAGAHSEKWVNLERPTLSGREVKPVRFASKLLINVYLDGVYHVFDEPAQFCSDLTATSPKMKPGSIGKLHLGIVKAVDLPAMKTKNGIDTTDAYCVAKYGSKWIRTSTIVGSFEPNWNGQYQWDVYDPCTVITVGVFHNNNLEEGPEEMESFIARVRIRLSTLECGKVYTFAYPLVTFNPGLKKAGYLHLHVVFDCPNMWNLLSMYGQPLLPKAHHTHPLSVFQLNTLRRDAVALIWLKLSRSTPPLRQEVVEHMLKPHSRVWSYRRARANYVRVLELVSYWFAAWQWYDDIREWKNLRRTVTVWFSFVTFLIFPWLILPMLFLYLFLTSIWNYRKRPKHPPFYDMKLSQVEAATVDDWMEEFDTFPSSAPFEIMRTRYDRLRSIGQELVAAVGDALNQLDRVQCVMSWRDPRATFLFAVFCPFAVYVTYTIPFKKLLFFYVTYLLRGPRFRVTLPPIPQNFLRRLPSKEDCML